MSASSPLFVIIAGEASGDRIAAEIVRAIRERLPEAEITGMAGEHMIAAGCQPRWHIDQLSLLGFAEVFSHLWRLWKLRRNVIQYCLQRRPTVFIGVDAPAFNLSIEQRLRRAGIKTVHFNSPKIWAWRRGRIHKIARSVSLMLTQFPFEKKLYDDAGVAAQYVGHPLADVIPLQTDRASARATLGCSESQPILALMPGSRQQEIAYLARDFIEAAARCQQKIPNLKCLVPLVNQRSIEQFKRILSETNVTANIEIVEGQSHQVLAACDAVIIASGTATLEALLLKRPMVVAYRMHPLTFHCLKHFVHSEYVSLPNVIAQKALVAEFLQDDVTADNLANAILPYLSQPALAKRYQRAFTQIHQLLRHDAAEATADAVLSLAE